MDRFASDPLHRCARAGMMNPFSALSLMPPVTARVLRAVLVSVDEATLLFVFLLSVLVSSKSSSRHRRRYRHRRRGRRRHRGVVVVVEIVLVSTSSSSSSSWCESGQWLVGGHYVRCRSTRFPRGSAQRIHSDILQGERKVDGIRYCNQTYHPNLPHCMTLTGFILLSFFPASGGHS